MELADQGHLISCDVTATNSEGRTEAESSNGLAIAALRTPSRPELTFPPAPPPTAAQSLASLRVQLMRVHHAMRIASLRKTGYYVFSFTALTAGKLELSWYQVPTSAHHSATAKPVLLAFGSTSYAGPATKKVKLRLTSWGRRLIGSSSSIKLSVKGVFVAAKGRPVTLLTSTSSEIVPG